MRYKEKEFYFNIIIIGLIYILIVAAFPFIYRWTLNGLLYNAMFLVTVFHMKGELELL